MNYVFIDELQLVFSIINPIYTDGKYVIAKKEDKDIITFVEVILGLSREKYIDVYATGSNSKMLSSDIISEFRDIASKNIINAQLNINVIFTFLFLSLFSFNKSKIKNPIKEQIAPQNSIAALNVIGSILFFSS